MSTADLPSLVDALLVPEDIGLRVPTNHAINAWAATLRQRRPVIPVVDVSTLSAHASYSKLPRVPTTAAAAAAAFVVLPLRFVTVALATLATLLVLDVARSWMRYVWPVLWLVTLALLIYEAIASTLARTYDSTHAFTHALDQFLAFTAALACAFQSYHALSDVSYERFFAGAATLTPTTSAFRVWTYFIAFSTYMTTGSGVSVFVPSHWSTRILTSCTVTLSLLYRINIAATAAQRVLQ